MHISVALRIPNVSKPSPPLTLTVEPSDDVLSIKNSIQHKLGVRTKDQKIVYGGVLLEDEATLQQLNVKDGDTVNVLITPSTEVEQPPPEPLGEHPTFNKPKVISLQPNVGPTSGGTKIFVLGENFRPDSICRFGPVLTPIRYRSENLLQVISPSHPAGVVSVRICNPLPASFSHVGSDTLSLPTELRPSSYTEQEQESTDTGRGTDSEARRQVSVSWSNSDVLFHYVGRDPLDSFILVPASTESCREKIAEGIYGLGATTWSTGRRDSDDGGAV